MLHTDTVTDSTSRLPRALGLMSAVALVIGITIGSGIFRSPAVVAQHVPNAAWFLGLWAVGGLVCLCGALSFAELAAAFPETGGFYVYLREGWGRLAAFLFGWAELALIRASALGGIAIVFSDYTLRSLGIDSSVHVLTSRGLAAAALAFAAIVNIAGVNLGAAVVRASTAAKLVALTVLIGSALMLGGSHGASIEHLTAGGAGTVSVGGLGLGLVSVLWAYDGFADVSLSAGEVKTPHRTLPLAIVLGTAVIASLYVLINAAYLYVIPVGDMAGSPLVAADMMKSVLGSRGGVLVSMFVALSAFGALSGSMLASPRVFFAMAEDRLFFPGVAKVHPRFKTPHVAIALAALLGMTLVTSRSFEALTSMFVVAIWPFYALCVAALYRLRLRRPDRTRPYRAPGYPVVPAIFIAAAVWILTNALITEPVATGTTFAVILSGVPIYFALFGERDRAA